MKFIWFKSVTVVCFFPSVQHLLVKSQNGVQLFWSGWNDLRACMRSLLGLGGTALANCVLGMEMADGGKNIGSRIPNWHTDWLFGKMAKQLEWAYEWETNTFSHKHVNFTSKVSYIYIYLTVIPHHWHLIPVRHSADQHVLRHLIHFELLGRLPSWKWWIVPFLASLMDFAGS